MKKISVILTTYNSEKYIQRTLDSILNQQGLNEEFTLELIVVDDCSTDNTTTILRKNNINFISTGHNSGGPNKGRNIGLEKATGDYICIMDHDDEWMPHKTTTQLSFCGLSPIITSGFTVINSSSQAKLEFRSKPTTSLGYNKYTENETFLKLLSKDKKGQLTYLGCILFDKSLKNIYFEESTGMLDFDWVLKLYKDNNSIEVCDSLYNRYIMGNNLSFDKSYRIKDYQYSLLTIEKYRKEYPHETTLGSKRVNGTMARYYYYIGEMKEARSYFEKSSCSIKTLLFYLTTFYGHRFIKRKFPIFSHK